MCYRLADEGLRDELKKPLGKLVKGEDVAGFVSGLPHEAMIITVGDMTTETLVELGIRPKVEVVDMKEKRSPRAEPKSMAERVIRVKNDPGTISAEAFNAIRDAITLEGSTRIIVEGEEDLLALPAIILAPYGSYVFYGQPNEGMVCVEVGKGTKDHAKRLLEMFESC